MIKLDIGSGRNPEPGNYKRLDGDPQFKPDYLCNIEKEPIPIPDNECSEIIINHCLEHISFRKTKQVIREIRRTLAPNGILKIRVPDFDYIVKTYLGNEPITQEWPSDMEAMKELVGEWNHWAWANVKLFSGQEEDWNFHKIGFSFDALKKILEDCGFRVVTRHTDWPVHSPGELQVSCVKPASSEIRDVQKDLNKILFIIPTAGDKAEELATNCVRSMRLQEPDLADRGHHILIIDDTGNSKPPATTRDLSVIYRKENGGFGKAVNDGLAMPDWDIACVVNSDIVFEKPFIDEILKSFSKDEKIGVVGARLHYPDGTLQHGGMEWDGAWIRHVGQNHNLANWPGLTKDRYCISVTGALFCIRRELYDKIGGFSPIYPLSCEDADYCMKAWSEDFRVLYAGGLEATHGEGKSRGATPQEKSERNPKWIAWEEESRENFAKRLKTTDMDGLQQLVNETNKANYKPGVTVIRRTGALGDAILASPLVQKFIEENQGEMVYISTWRPDAFREVDGLVGIVSHPEQVDYTRFIDLDWVYERNPKIGIQHNFAIELGLTPCEPTPILESGIYDFDSFQRKFPHTEFRNLVTVHMPKTWTAKTWPGKNWGDLLHRLTLDGYKIAVVGGGNDFRVPDSENVFNLAGPEGHTPLTIHEIHSVIKRSKLFIGMDSGILHVAGTTDTPIVAMFTVADPKQVFNYQRKARTIRLSPMCECRFCLHREVPPVTNVECQNKDYLLCLKQLEPKIVYDQCKKILEGKP